MNLPVPRALRDTWRPWRRALALAALALAGCGGGDQVSPFHPDRLVSLGDETSVIDASQRKYTVNALATDGSLDCGANPLWIQHLASTFGFVFEQCNPAGLARPGATTLAVPGATVADVAQQVDAQLAAGGFGGALVSVLVGMHDLLPLYAQYPGVDAATLKDRAEQAGRALAAQVNRIGAAGGKVLVATVIDLGLTPFALAEKAAHTDTDRAALLTALARAFNNGLRLDLVNDGRQTGLLLADELVQAIVDNPSASSFGFDNVTDAVCTIALPDCTTATLTPGTRGDTWLWADDLHLSAGGQLRLGRLARTRAHNNPF